MTNRELLAAIQCLLDYLKSGCPTGSDMVKATLKSLLEEQTRRSLEQKDE